MSQSCWQYAIHIKAYKLKHVCTCECQGLWTDINDSNAYTW